MAFIKIIEPEEATGELKDIYDSIIKSRGKLANIHKIQSLNPKSIIWHMELYLGIMFKESPLSRAQREMLAVVVSSANNCNYCQIHHSLALNHYWKDSEKIKILKRDFSKANLSPSDLLLCELAWQLTRIPGVSTEGTIIKLRKLGISDRIILDTTLIIGYFNFVNRIVLGLGVYLEEDKGMGYKY